MGWRNKRLAHNVLSFTATRVEGRPEILQFSRKISPHFNREKPLRQSVFSCGNIMGIYVQHFKCIRAFCRIIKQAVTNNLSTKIKHFFRCKAVGYGSFTHCKMCTIRHKVGKNCTAFFGPSDELIKKNLDSCYNSQVCYIDQYRS